VVPYAGGLARPRYSAVFLGMVLALATGTTQASDLPPGSTLSVRLTSHLSSRDSRAGEPLEALLIAPVRLAGRAVVPAGTLVRGHVTEARGGFGRRSRLKLAFDDLLAPDGARVAIDARVREVDNARETVAADGTIVGLPPFSSAPSPAHLALLIAAHAHPLLLAMVEAGRLAGRRAQHGAIDYGPGVELELALERAASLPDARAATATAPFGPGPAEEELAAVVLALPLRAVAPKGGRPSDLTNLLLVGSRAELEAAFVAAGWTRAEDLRARTAARGLLALAGKRAYQPAPVSLLELEGRAPDLVFEKQCNTLAKRHHVRLWGGYLGPGGAPAWVGAASHDVGIGFSRAERAFTHRVDPRIDLERSKVADDLLFTGGVESVALVERPLAPRTFTTAAGARIETDGQMAVLMLGRAPRGGPTTVASAAP